MNTEKIRNLKNFYHDHLMNKVMPFWVNSELIDKEYGGFITSIVRLNNSSQRGIHTDSISYGAEYYEEQGKNFKKNLKSLVKSVAFFLLMC